MSGHVLVTTSLPSEDHSHKKGMHIPKGRPYPAAIVWARSFKLQGFSFCMEYLAGIIPELSCQIPLSPLLTSFRHGLGEWYNRAYMALVTEPRKTSLFFTKSTVILFMIKSQLHVLNTWLGCHRYRFALHTLRNDTMWRSRAATRKTEWRWYGRQLRIGIKGSGNSTTRLPRQYRPIDSLSPIT